MSNLTVKPKQAETASVSATATNTTSVFESLKQSTRNLFQKVPPYERLLPLPCTEDGNSNSNPKSNTNAALSSIVEGLGDTFVRCSTATGINNVNVDNISRTMNALTSNVKNDQAKLERLRSIRHDTARSKSGVVWGPTHSFDSDEECDHNNDNEDHYHYQKSDGEGTNTTQEESFSCTNTNTNANSPRGTNSPNTSSTRKSKAHSSTTNQTSPNKTNHDHSNNTGPGTSNTKPMFGFSPSTASPIGVMLNNASVVISEFTGECFFACNQCRENDNDISNVNTTNSRSKTRTNFFNNNPFTKRGGGSNTGQMGRNKKHNDDEVDIVETLGIQRLSPPSKVISLQHQKSNLSNTSSLTDAKHYKKSKQEIGDEDARAAAKLVAKTHHNNQSKIISLPIPTPISPKSRKQQQKQGPPSPFNVISVNSAIPFQNSISELTMKSSFGEAITPVSDMRRMAYYAVGKSHSPKGTKTSNNNSNNGGGNRKCYFTGNPIISGQPFYAGSVQQGLRTLIVFCLPIALGLPRKEDIEKVSEMVDIASQGNVGRTTRIGDNISVNDLSRRIKSGLSTAALSQHDSIYNDERFVISELFHPTTTNAWTEDENGNVCENLTADFIMQALPDPNRDLLLNMQELYPEEFESLSPQLRRPQCWRLYIKFCFFSGLPIADGEMYYKVVDDVVHNYGKKNMKTEEIALSHEVMEVVSGDSAEILTLPSKKTFQYLQTHYKQQCAKLTPIKLYKKVFDRSNWIRVMPEV